VVSASHIRQVVNQVGADITIIDSGGNQTTEKAKIEEEQAGGNLYAWSDRTDLQMPAKILLLPASVSLSDDFLFEFENKTWWIADTREVNENGNVTGYRVLVLDSLKGQGMTLTDGNDSVEIVSARYENMPGALKRGDIEIPGSDTNEIQDLGKTNESVDVVIQVGRWTELNGSRAGSIDNVESILKAWHEGQTTLQLTDLDSVTDDVLIEIDNIERFADVKIALVEASLTKVNH